MNQVCLKVTSFICRMHHGLKPSELAPLSSMILAEIIDETKFQVYLIWLMVMVKLLVMH